MTRSDLIAIWDVWIRLFHWTLAASVGFLLYTGLTGDLFFDWHRDIGELVLLLIVFRLVWGVIGSSNARLIRLFRSPVEGVDHIRHFAKREVPLEREHNAAGAWAVIAMILMLGTQAVTGLFIADEDEFVEGAFYGDVSSDLSDWMYRIHHINAELIQIILIVHIGMVLLYWLYAKRNLVLPMFTGKINWTSDTEPPSIVIRQWWIGALALMVCSVLIGWLVGWY
ncbi:MAG: cytochrome b/b6 domain-containing protein [Granulosicoccus sp.]